MATEIGRLIAVFTAETKDFDAGVRRVEASMRSTAQTVSTSQKQISLSTTRGMKDIGAGGLTLRQELSAVASLQRQKSASIIRDWKSQERAALSAAAGIRPFREVLQNLSTSVATLQGPLGGIAGRLSSITSLTDQLNTKVGGSSSLLAGLLPVLGGVAVGLGAVIATGVGLFKLASAAAMFGDRLGDLSQRTGISVGTLSALKIAAENTGGSIETTNQSLGRYLRGISEANSGNERLRRQFEQVGFTSEDLTKAYKSSDDAVAILVKRVGELSGEEDRLNALQKIGVRNGQELNGVINEMRGDLEKFRKEAEALGLVVTPDQAQEADRFDKTLRILQLQVKGMAFSIAREYLPQISGAMNDISTSLNSNKGAWASWGDFIKTEIIGIRVAASGLAAFIQSLPSVGGHVGVAGIIGIRAMVEKSRELKSAEDLAKSIGGGVSLNDTRAEKPIGPGGGGGGRGGGKGESALERASKQALEMSRIQLRGAESVYRDALEKEQAYYDQSLTSLETFSQKRIELENERYNAQREVFTKEQRLISTGAFKPGERTTKQAELNQSIEDAERKHFATLRSIRADDKREQQDADKRHNDAVISLHEDSLKSLESSLLRAVSVRKKTAVQAEEEMFAAMQQVLTEKGEQLQTELGRVLMNPNQAREVQDQIDALNLEMEQRAKEHIHKLDDARQEDVQSAIDYSRQLRSVADDIIANDLDTARIRLQAIRDNTLYRTEAIREEARIEKAAEQQRTASTVQELRERKRLIKAEADALKSDPFEAVRQMKAIDQQIAAIQRNSAARQVEIQRQAQEQILEKWREVSRDITDILSAGITGGFKGALDSVKQVLDQVSKEILNSAIIKILQPNAPNQGSQAGGIIGAITNKILDSIGLGKKTAAQTRPRVVGEPDTLAEKASTIGDRVTVSQTQATRELNRARTEQTQQLLSSLNGIAEHLCQCSKSPQESLKDTIGSVISAGISLIPTRGSTTRPNVSSVVRDIPEAGGVILPGGGTGGATRPRIVGPQVTPQTVNDASKSISTSIMGQTRERTVTSQTQTQDLKNTIQLTGQQIVQGLTPAQQGFGAGLLQAAIGGAISGLASGLTSGIGGSGGFNNEGPITPRPTVAPKMKFRASGGPVSAMTPYVVGEKGPEMFVPRSHGDIYNQQQMRNMGNEVHNHYTINLPSAPKGSYTSPKSKREMADALMAALQASQR